MTSDAARVGRTSRASAWEERCRRGGYVRHAERWERIDIAGSIADRNCLVAFREGNRTLAVASIYRDVGSLRAELAMERRDKPALLAVIPGTE